MRMSYKMASASLVLTAFISLSGCVATLPVNYAPSSTMSVSGTISVADFSYSPAENGRVKPNQIRNTAIGNMYFDQNIDLLVRDAVFKELRFVGIKVNGEDNKLTGEIEEFLIDDLGYSVDWTLRIRYVAKGVDGVLYESTKETKRKTGKFANLFGALNETIKLNVEELLKDSEFISVIQ